MDYDVVEARYVGGHAVWLRFQDGTAGEIDLSSELYGPVFEPLRDLVIFSQFQVHPEFRTLVWANGADFAPEFLHSKIRVTA
jgi:hypothetical protein